MCSLCVEEVASVFCICGVCLVCVAYMWSVFVWLRSGSLVIMCYICVECGNTVGGSITVGVWSTCEPCWICLWHIHGEYVVYMWCV